MLGPEIAPIGILALICLVEELLPSNETYLSITKKEENEGLVM